ncbi:MAG: hypothetical protein Q8K36_04050 [Alphaproteobacteria bacterium]|nr:hypothetical protein [Alphaproteobacteria bacterium]
MNKRTQQKNKITLAILVILMTALFGVGFLRINGRTLPQKKKSILPGIGRIIDQHMQEKDHERKNQ